MQLSNIKQTVYYSEKYISELINSDFNYRRLAKTDPSKSQILIDKIYRLYNIYKDINEDYKNIDIFKAMKKLNLDETEVNKLEEKYIKLKEDPLCPEIYKCETEF